MGGFGRWSGWSEVVYLHSRLYVGEQALKWCERRVFSSIVVI